MLVISLIQGDRHFLERTLTRGWDRSNKRVLFNSGLVENAWVKSYKDFKFEKIGEKLVKCQGNEIFIINTKQSIGINYCEHKIQI